MARVQEQVSNKQVLASGHITGNPKQPDTYFKSSTVSLQLPLDASNAVLVKNLHLSCDPYMRGTKKQDKNRLYYSFSPDSPIIGYGVCKVLDSKHPNFRKGDLVWEVTKWEEYYSIITKFLDTILLYIREGKITYIEDIAQGIESGPAALEAMFEGRSAGKQVVLVAHE